MQSGECQRVQNIVLQYASASVSNECTTLLFCRRHSRASYYVNVKLCLTRKLYNATSYACQTSCWLFTKPLQNFVLYYLAKRDFAKAKYQLPYMYLPSFVMHNHNKVVQSGECLWQNNKVVQGSVKLYKEGPHSCLTKLCFV